MLQLLNNRCSTFLRIRCVHKIGSNSDAVSKIDGLMQGGRNSIALEFHLSLEIHLFCINPLNWSMILIRTCQDTAFVTPCTMLFMQRHRSAEQIMVPDYHFVIMLMSKSHETIREVNLSKFGELSVWNLFRRHITHCNSSRSYKNPGKKLDSLCYRHNYCQHGVLKLLISHNENGGTKKSKLGNVCDQSICYSITTSRRTFIA